MRNCLVPVLIVVSAVIVLFLPSCSSDSKPNASKPGAGKPDAGKSGKQKPTTKATLTPEQKLARKWKNKAKKHFATYCVLCHGKTGKGDGPGSIPLKVKPRNWTDPVWQDSKTDDEILAVIRDGGAKHGLSELMAPNPLWADNTAVLKELVKKVRSMRKDPAH